MTLSLRAPGNWCGVVNLQAQRAPGNWSEVMTPNSKGQSWNSIISKPSTCDILEKSSRKVESAQKRRGLHLHMIKQSR